MAKPSKNNTLITILIAGAALLYFVYQLKADKQSQNISADSQAIKEEIQIMGELSAPVEENNKVQNTQDSNQTSSSSVEEVQVTNLTNPNVGIDINNIPEDLPEDLKEQLKNPPPLPDDLRAQLEGPPPPIPPDIEQALKTEPREVSIDEVNNPRLSE